MEQEDVEMELAVKKETPLKKIFIKVKMEQQNTFN